MTTHSKLTLAALALLLPALLSAAANAQLVPNYARPPAPATPAPPQVVAFVGDWLTDGWSATFPASWIDTDVNGETQMAAAIALKPSLIHIMVGSTVWDDDAGYNLVTAYLEEALIQDITQAQGAGIPVIVGIEPLECSGYETVPSMDLIVYAVATKYGVPIINYSGAFSNAQVGYGGNASASGGGTALGFGPSVGQFPGSGSFFVPNPGPSIYSANLPSPAGYAIMTMMAQTAFATLNAQPRSLYLQDTLLEGNECSDCSYIPTYTNGVSGAGFNGNFLTGSNGTWTSSNPLVGFVNQSGEFWAFNQGQTTVKFTLPNGVWNEWIMYVGAPFPG
jgi:hypothetical protein